MIKPLRIVIVMLMLGGAIYFFLSKDNASRYTFPTFKSSTDKPIISSLKQVSKKVVEAIPKLVQGVVKKGEEIVSDVEAKIKASTFDLFKKAANEQINNLGERLGIDVREEGTPVDDSPVSFAIRAATPAYFTIENYENESVIYDVDWQDGNKDAGHLDKDKEISLSHSWNKKGDYILQFKITSSKNTKYYQIKMSII